MLAKRGQAPERPAKPSGLGGADAARVNAEASAALASSTQPGNAPKAGEQTADQAGSASAQGAATKPLEQPAQPAVPTQRDVQEWIAKERETYEAKRRAESAESETKQARERAERLKAMNPIELLAEFGHTYEGAAEGIVKGKYKELTPEQLALKAHDDRVAALEKELESYRTEKTAAEKRSKTEAQAQQLQAELKEKYISRWPVLAALPDAGARIIELKERFPDESYDAIANHLEKLHGDQVRSAFSSDAALKTLLADEATKSRVLSLLNIKSEQLAQQVPQGKTRIGNGPDAIPSTHASTPGQRSEPRREGRQSRVDAALAAAKNSQRARLG